MVRLCFLTGIISTLNRSLRPVTWKRLNLILIPHSNEKVKQISVKRTTILAFALFLIVATGIMVFYIISFRGKTSYRDSTQKLAGENSVIAKHFASFDSSLTAMSNQVASLESVNVSIMKDSDISDMDLKLSDELEIYVSQDGVKLPPDRVLSIIDRMDTESKLFESNFSTLFKYCMNDSNYIKHVPSIRPADGYISKEFGRYFDRVSKMEKIHSGIDIHNIEGTPVVATADGVIKKIGFSEELGRYIVIDHENGYETQYAHIQTLKQMKKKIHLRQGTKVKRSQQIGTIGQTGISIQAISAHLMYSVYHHGLPMNPTEYFFASDPAALLQEKTLEAQKTTPYPE